MNYRNTIPVLFIGAVYLVLFFVSLNQVYFWDNIQQVSKEAHWYYLTNFSSFLIPEQNATSEIFSTGYHPPLMGIMTAFLWKTFGYHLAVSHVFSLFWATILVYNVWKLIKNIFPEASFFIVFILLLLEPTVLSNFSLSSPDFILLTSFVACFRGILEKNKTIILISALFLCLINIRGTFLGVFMIILSILEPFLVHNDKISRKSIVNSLLPFIPVITLLVIYYSYYFVQRGWFFTHSAYASHYEQPNNLSIVIHNLSAYVLRSLENGRFVIWILATFSVFLTLKNKQNFSSTEKLVLVLFLLSFSLYFVFCVISQMPFSSRYFMPQFFLLTLFCLLNLSKHLTIRKMYLVYVLVLLAELTGHFWIYPETMAKCWDGTLAHMSYFDLRKQCFDYIEEEKISYSDLSSGLCLAGNRKYTELIPEDKIVGDEMTTRYFIYSNISNVSDATVAELKTTSKWRKIKSFKKGFCFIDLYENRSTTAKITD